MVRQIFDQRTPSQKTFMLNFCSPTHSKFKKKHFHRNLLNMSSRESEYGDGDDQNYDYYLPYPPPMMPPSYVGFYPMPVPPDPGQMYPGYYSAYPQPPPAMIYQPSPYTYMMPPPGVQSQQRNRNEHNAKEGGRDYGEKRGNR
eukprot:TRINITY_DN3738_c0_g1_i1.p1 TRINITY_DN3738_c0_g1~~TRINITY_DN3738_c0_g1_i1.p1  ORF type:complete len:143 (-),score=12.78 TRINITY_DN3738_c0_g1_i1:171-599(-)